MSFHLRCGLIVVGLWSLAACASDAPPKPAAASVPAPAPAPAPAVTPAAPSPAPDPKVLGLWRIEQARSAPLVDKRAARIDLRPDGSAVGNASCNSFTGRYTLQGDRLKLGPLVTTRKACSESLMEQEDRVLTALERAARATVPPHGFLTLQDAEGAVLMRASRFEVTEAEK